jgi:ABC-type ATPase with predicted acetyltransferase domain
MCINLVSFISIWFILFVSFKILLSFIGEMIYYSPDVTFMRNRREIFRIRTIRRTYDKTRDRFTFDISYETHTELTPRTVEVAEAFGLGIDDTQKFQVLNAQLQISPKDIVYITGDSGSGKSVLLKAIKADLGGDALEMSEVEVDPERPIIETVGDSVEQALQLLSSVGLNDAFLFLRKYSQLSDGQRFRYRLAKFLESDKKWLLVDEFAATLDRDTAKIVSFNLQKLARKQGKAVIVATTHSDLFEDLAPSVYVYKRFGDEISISYYPNQPAAQCSLLKEMAVEPGTLEDWRKLSAFHYRSHNTTARRAVFSIRRKDELCAVIVYCYPFPQCAGRNKVLPKMPLAELNQKLCSISRIVVHPKYRTIGLGEKLIRDSLPKTGTPYVEMIAVMPRYNPFAERAGMKKVFLKGPPKEALIVASVLMRLSFDLHFLGSQTYVKNKLAELNPGQLAELRTTFSKNGHPMFREAVAAIRHAKRNTKNYTQEVEKAELEKIARLIKITGILLQTKAYLFLEKKTT